jgi:hypothetical protein
VCRAGFTTDSTACFTVADIKASDSVMQPAATSWVKGKQFASSRRNLSYRGATPHALDNLGFITFDRAELQQSFASSWGEPARRYLAWRPSKGYHKLLPTSPCFICFLILFKFPSQAAPSTPAPCWMLNLWSQMILLCVTPERLLLLNCIFSRAWKQTVA